jgi:plastocyanin
MTNTPAARLRMVALILAAAVVAAGCGSDSEPVSDEPAKETAKAAPEQLLRLEVVTAPGQIAFDKKRLEAKAGQVTLELRNGQDIGHNVRVQTGRRCCFAPGSKDVGGTPTIVNKTARTTLDLDAGTYQFLCSLGGHWQRGQRGVLIVRG